MSESPRRPDPAPHHTPEPWKFEPFDQGDDAIGIRSQPAFVFANDSDGDPVIICEMRTPAYAVEPDPSNEYDDGICELGEGNSNARRVVACINACRNIPTEDLERGDLIAAIDKNLDERAELLEACRRLSKLCHCRGKGVYDHECNDYEVECKDERCTFARAVIAKIEGAAS